MQGQPVADVMGNLRCWLESSGLELDPIAASLLNDRAVQVEQGIDHGIPSPRLLYHLLITRSNPRTGKVLMLRRFAGPQKHPREQTEPCF